MTRQESDVNAMLPADDSAPDYEVIRCFLSDAALSSS
jgi:hypothetical protein